MGSLQRVSNMCFRKIPDTMEGGVEEEAGAFLPVKDG